MRLVRTKLRACHHCNLLTRTINFYRTEIPHLLVQLTSQTLRRRRDPRPISSIQGTMMSTTPSRRPSSAVTKGGTLVTGLGSAVELIAAWSGHPLPVGTGAILGGALTAVAAYFSRGGRQNEPQ